MTMFSERVWAVDHRDCVHLLAVDDATHGPVLELTVDDQNTDMTVRLDADSVRNLRLALTHYERWVSG